MSDIQTMNSLSQAVLTFKSDMESLEYRLEQLSKSDSKASGILELVINNNKRGTSRYWLHKEVLIEILNRRLDQAKTAHADATEAYQSFLKEKK